MPRFSATNTEQMFVDSTKPPKENRRDALRHKILVPASVLQKDEEAKMVKVVNLGLGGCKFVGHDKLSIHKIIMIQFYLQTDDEEWKACIPINAKVLHTVSKKDRFVTNLSFKSSIYAEHGIEHIINNYPLTNKNHKR
jgi:hypothetical protein